MNAKDTADFSASRNPEDTLVEVPLAEIPVCCSDLENGLVGEFVKVVNFCGHFKQFSKIVKVTKTKITVECRNFMGHPVNKNFSKHSGKEFGGYNFADMILPTSFDEMKREEDKKTKEDIYVEIKTFLLKDCLPIETLIKLRNVLHHDGYSLSNLTSQNKS